MCLSVTSLFPIKETAHAGFTWYYPVVQSFFFTHILILEIILTVIQQVLSLNCKQHQKIGSYSKSGKNFETSLHEILNLIMLMLLKLTKSLVSHCFHTDSCWIDISQSQSHWETLSLMPKISFMSKKSVLPFNICLFITTLRSLALMGCCYCASSADN